MSIAYDPGATSGTGFNRGMSKLVQWLAARAFNKWLMKRAGITMGSLDFSISMTGEFGGPEPDPFLADVSQVNRPKSAPVPSAT